MSWNPFFVSAQALHNRTVVHGDTVIRDVTFLPFFDRSGNVKRILTLTPDRPGIGSLPPDSTLPRISNFGRIRIPSHVPLFYELRKADLPALTTLWHFDPWWLLDEDRFANHWARSPLKATNCIPCATGGIVSILYRSNLTAATWIFYRLPADGFPIARWKPNLLPAPPSPTPPTPAAASPHWILDPIWTRK